MAYRITANKEDKRYVERRIAAIAKELKEYANMFGCGIHVDTGYVPKYGAHTSVWLFSPDTEVLSIDEKTLSGRKWLDREFK